VTTGSIPVSRKIIRDALAAGLAAGMPSAAAVYGYQKTDFGSLSPVVRIAAAGVLRPQMEARGIRSEFRFSVQLWVLFAGTGQGWTEADAEDQLDQLEYELISWISNNQNTGDWTGIQYSDLTVVDVLDISGTLYLVEEIPLTVRVWG
jgi:hypothetical protein